MKEDAFYGQLTIYIILYYIVLYYILYNIIIIYKEISIRIS